MQTRISESINRTEPWMTHHERIFYRRFVESVEDTLSSRKVTLTPMVALRVNDVGVSFLLVRRVESELGRLHREDDEAPASAKSPTLLTLVDAIGKAREKMRKAINELESCCPSAATAVDAGIADMVKPLVQKAAVAGV